MLRVLTKVGIGIAVLAFLVGSPGLAQSDADIKKEIEELKQGQRSIQKQLVELKRLVQAQAKPAAKRQGPKVEGVVFNLGDAVVKGEDSAKLTLIEFTDYQ